MNIQPNIIITKRLNRVLIACFTVAMFVFTAALGFAHGGFDHVMGTVVKVADHVMTVKTTKGNVDVKLDDKTEFTKNDQKAQFTDLTPGTRVVVDIPEGSKEKLAHSVKIGTATKTAHQ